MILYIKYMVSLRCRMLVESELDALQVKHFAAELGSVETVEDINPELRQKLAGRLLVSGLELLGNRKAILIERIKNAIVELIHHSGEVSSRNYSSYLSEKLGYDYAYLSNIFSEVKGITIQHFIILHRIEKVKELILYDELTLTEISHRLSYSSVAHLSNQFKKVTGLSPSYYRRMKRRRTMNLENI
jgi:AraC-like DNA-binding protein